MIKRYSDHAANERTFLAWVRTGIAVMAFGFLVEKFDLFLEIASKTLERQALSPDGRVIGNVAGLALILLGGAMILLATVRFRRTAKQIDDEAVRPGTGERMDLTLAVLLMLLGSTLFAYLLYTVVTKL
jgi:putative membrane protein